jgi:hypothetical protein
VGECLQSNFFEERGRDDSFLSDILELTLLQGRMQEVGIQHHKVPSVCDDASVDGSGPHSQRAPPYHIRHLLLMLDNVNVFM